MLWSLRRGGDFFAGEREIGHRAELAADISVSCLFLGNGGIISVSPEFCTLQEAQKKLKFLDLKNFLQAFCREF